MSLFNHDRNLYREELLEHVRAPANRGGLQDATHSSTKKNVFCGDIIKLDVKVSDGNIKDIGYEPDACAVCLASASVLTDEVKGKSVEFAKGFSKEELLDLLGVNLTTSRISCAELP